MRLPGFWLSFALMVPAVGFAQQPMPTGNSGSMPMAQMVATPAAPASDHRHVIQLTTAQREMLLADMRQMLVSVQGVVDGLARGNMQAVSAAARQSGTTMMQGLPASTRRRFPNAFTQLGMASHRAFDRIAEEARDRKRPAVILGLLSQSLQSCSACHAAYRFGERR